MNGIPAVYENGVFRPINRVELLEGTKVVIETEEVVEERVRAARRKVVECLSRSYDTGEPGNGLETHNNHQP